VADPDADRRSGAELRVPGAVRDADAHRCLAPSPATAGSSGTDGVEQLHHPIDHLHPDLLQLRTGIVWTGGRIRRAGDQRYNLADATGDQCPVAPTLPVRYSVVWQNIGITTNRSAQHNYRLRRANYTEIRFFTNELHILDELAKTETC